MSKYKTCKNAIFFPIMGEYKCIMMKNGICKCDGCKFYKNGDPKESAKTYNKDPEETR